jgi:hypothetical protein
VNVAANQEIDVVIVISDVQAGTVDSGVYVPAGSLQIRNCTYTPVPPSPVTVQAFTGALDWTRRINW